MIGDELVRSHVIWKMRVKKRIKAAEAEVEEEKGKRMGKKSVAGVAAEAEMQKMEATSHVVAEVNIEKMVKKVISLAEAVVDIVKMERREISLSVAGASTEVKEKKVTSQDVVVAKLEGREKKENQKVAQEANLGVEMT